MLTVIFKYTISKIENKNTKKWASTVTVILKCKISEIKNKNKKKLVSTDGIYILQISSILHLSEIISLTICLNWMDGSDCHF